MSKDHLQPKARVKNEEEHHALEFQNIRMERKEFSFS